jgi:hypothetical protein
MTGFSRTFAFVVATMMFASCASANDAAFVPLLDVVNATSPERVVLVLENTSNLPSRSERDSVGAMLTQVELDKNHTAMVGFNEAYIAGYDLHDGEVAGKRFADGAPRSPYQIFSAPGPFQYALTEYYRNNGTILENVCYFKRSVVFQLKPGVVNFIPKRLQPPIYDGRPLDSAARKPDTTELKRILSRFPIGAMDIAVPDVVAIVEFVPDQLDRVLSANDCSYTNDFRIVARYDAPQ